MGSCLSHSILCENKRIVYDVQRTSPTLNLTSQLELQFALQLSNVSVVIAPKTELNLVFRIGQLLDFSLPFSKAEWGCMQDESPSRQMKWKQHYTCRMQMSEQKMRREYLVIVAYDSLGVLLQQIKINLWIIANGPIHHNLKIHGDNDSCRLVFDCRLSQVFEAHFDFQQVEMVLDRQYPGEEFNFSLKVLVSEQLVKHSEPSYCVQLPINSFSSSSDSYPSQDECSNPADQWQLPRGSDSQISPNNSLYQKIIWTNGETDASLPSFLVDITASELVKYQLQLILWLIRPGESATQEAVFFASAQLPFWKVFEKSSTQKEQLLSDAVSRAKLQERLLVFEHKLLRNQCVIGLAKLTFTLRNCVYAKQNKYGARTEKGIMSIEPVLKHPVQQNLRQISNSLTEVWTASQQVDKLIAQWCKQPDKDLLSKLNTELMKMSSKLKAQIFSPLQKDIKQVLANQNILVSILQKMIPYVTLEDKEVADRVWQTIIAVLSRGELDIDQLSLADRKQFGQPQGQCHYSSLGAKYCACLLKLLSLAVDEIEERDSWTEHFKVFCFFRVPLFQRKVLQVVSNQQEQMAKRLDDLRESFEPKSSRQHIKQEQSWESYLTMQCGTGQLSLPVQDLQLALKSSIWLDQLYRKDDVFNSFVRKARQDSNSRTYHIGSHAYNSLLVSFLSQAGKKCIGEYTREMIKTAFELLEDKVLINLLMPMACQRSRLEDHQSVVLSLDLLREYFLILTANATCLMPDCFDYQYFFKVVRTVLQSEHHSCSTSKVLELVFDFYEYFGEIPKQNLSYYFLGKIFFKTFFSWSAEIRNTFYHVLLVRINRGGFTVEDQELARRYRKVISLAKASAVIKKKQNRDLAAVELSYVKKMKRKIYERRIRSINSPDQPLVDEPYKLKNLLTTELATNSQPIARTSSYLIDGTMSKLKSFNSSTDVSLDRRNRINSFNELPDQSMNSPSVSNQDYIQDPQACLAAFYRVASNKTEMRRKRKLSISIPDKPLQLRHYIYSMSGGELHELQEMTTQEQKFIIAANAQFAELEEWVDRHVFTHGTLPGFRGTITARRIPKEE